MNKNGNCLVKKEEIQSLKLPPFDSSTVSSFVCGATKFDFGDKKQIKWTTICIIFQFWLCSQ